MNRFIVIASFIAVIGAQQYHQDPRTAAIISEQRYLSGDGKFGAAYSQEDGIDFKEETDADGTRHGSYSYIDPTGQKRQISYTAGKNGFQASGDHLPVAPAAPPQAAPQPQYQPQPRYNSQPQFPSAPAYQGDSGNYDDGQYDPRYNDPSFSGSGSHFSAPAPQQPSYHHTPAPAPAPVPQYNHFQHAAPAPQQQQQHFQPAPQQHFQPEYTTQNPHRFQPPGKLQLNRTPDGFSYSFNKV